LRLCCGTPRLIIIIISIPEQIFQRRDGRLVLVLDVLIGTSQRRVGEVGAVHSVEIVVLIRSRWNLSGLTHVGTLGLAGSRD
jgi:hypothetical protein